MVFVMQSNPEIYVLVNPHSGQGHGRTLLQEFNKISQTENLRVEAVNFERNSEQVELAQRSKICVIVGGDGTISTIAGRLGSCAAKIGILALGTGNDFARELGLLKRFKCKSLTEIIKFFRTAPSQPVSIFALHYGPNFEHHIPFINYTSIGFEAAVVKNFDRWRKSRTHSNLQSVWLNRLAYAVLSTRHLLYKNQGLRLSSGAYSQVIKPCSSLIFANVKSIMGLGISNSNGSLFDDRIECVLAKNCLSYLSMLTYLRLPLFRPTLIGSESTWQLTGLLGNLLIQLDGESIELKSPEKLKISLMHKLNVLC